MQPVKRSRRFIYDEKLGKCVEVKQVDRANRKTRLWPIMPDASGVNPEQIPEQMAYDRMMGVPTDYTPDGRPIITGQKHYRDHCRANGLFHRNAGYGDAAPLHYTGQTLYD